MNTRAPAVLKHYAVPVGTPKTKCKRDGCNTSFYWQQSANNRFIPIDCDHCTEECRHPTDSAPLFGETEATDGVGVSHFFTCPDADDFSHGRRN